MCRNCLPLTVIDDGQGEQEADDEAPISHVRVVAAARGLAGRHSEVHA
jgi:hypothetical protein